MAIIERTERDVERETIELFEACKPYLDKGYGFHHAVRIVKGISKTTGLGSQAWYKRFRKYAISQGYEPPKRGRKPKHVRCIE